MNLDIKTKIDLNIAKLEILKLKADNYNWQCNVPPDVKEQLEQILLEINRMLE